MDIKEFNRKELTQFWEGKRCLVTGGYGFGGGHLCEQLLNRGARVWVLDRESPKGAYLETSGLAPRVGYIPGDIRDLGLVKVTLDRFNIEQVFHLAAQPVLSISNSCPFETLSINAMGTFSVLEAVRTSGARPGLVFASSGKYYGTTFDNELIDEEFPPQPADNIYGPSKVAGDFAVRSYARTFGIKAAVCRFINIYGPGSRNVSTIVPAAIGKLINGEPYDFGSRDDGSSTFDYLNVKDVSRGYLAVAENLDTVSGEAFNFSGGQPISVKDLVCLISRLFDGQNREPLFHGPKKTIPERKCLDASKAAKRLGWRPSIDLEDGLKETITWYRQFWGK